jgi:hypothetical protein
VKENMINIQTIRKKDCRQIIKIKGILPNDKLPWEYTSNKSGCQEAFWKETVDGKETIVLRARGHLIGNWNLSEGDTVPEPTFQSIIQFMRRAGNRLHNINAQKKFGIGIKETIRI